MINYLRHSVAFLCLVLWSLIGSANPLTSFSDNPKEFLKDLKEYMTASKNAEMAAIYSDFESQFNKGLFSEKDFDFIQRTSNNAVDKKIPANPYFGRYLQNVILIRQQKKGDQVFTQWHEVTDALIENMSSRRFKPIKSFFEFGLHFFATGALQYSEKGVSWYAGETDYQLVYRNGEALVTFTEVDLQGELRDHKVRIIAASGEYFPEKNEWRGKGGAGTWEPGEADPTKVYRLLGAYVLELDKTVYQIDSVQLEYPELLPNAPIIGTFQDKMFIGKNAAKEVSYPRFQSTSSSLKVENLGKGMVFTGGLRLEGAKVYGVGDKDEKAEFRLFDEAHQEKIKIQSQLFVLKKGEQIKGESANCVLYFIGDSLYHPSTDFKLNIAENTIELTRGDRDSDRNPYCSSLHQINMDVDHIKWLLDKDQIEIGHRAVSFSNVQKKVVFESLKYFNESDYRRLQNISSTNPIATIKVFSEEKGTRFLDADALAKRINPRFEISSINSLIYDLVAKGFIHYDKDKKVVEVRDKVFHYANASQKMTSYDQLQIESVTDSTNAVWDLKNNTITTAGVNQIEFNKRHQVALKPGGGRVQLKQNRDLFFDGKLFAGFSTFLGKDFAFQYDKNQMVLDSIRYFDVFIPSEEVDEMGRPIALSIASRIEHANGILLIDAPENRGGEEDIPYFPAFKSKNQSFVYYDQSATLDGCYHRDSFYFSVDPFSLENLDHLREEQLEFPGNMVTAGIFSDFKETLTLDKADYSLGFVTNTPAAGFSNYQGKGQYFGEVSLSNRGLLAKGKVTYLGASINSEDIVFKPNQMTSSAEQFKLEEDRSGPVEVPQTIGYEVSIDWRPYVDSMYILSKERPFELFKEENYTLKGLQILTPGGLKGRGQFNWDKGKMNAELMSFGAFSVKADTAALQILTFESDDFAFDTRNVKTILDFDKKIGWVKANDENHITTMPYNQYKTSLSEFDWNMEEETITFKNEEGHLGKFTSTHPDKDSLHFDGATAFYNLKTNELQIGGVPYIQASDALIYPENGDVEIKTGGEMSTIKNAKIIADTISRYHVINRATVDILDGKEYHASGFYEYNIGERKQEIEFRDIVGARVGKGKKSEKKSLTRATGKVSPDDHLYIDHATEFRGDIHLKAEEINLEFNGFAQLKSPALPKANWFSIECKADKNNFAIDFDEPKNQEGQALYNGIFLSKEHARLYASVMAPLYFAKDRPIFTAKGEKNGLLKYDKSTDEFILGDSMRVEGHSRYGNLLRINNQLGTTVATGAIHIGSGLKHMKVTAGGQIKTTLNQEKDGTHGPALAEMGVSIMAGIDMQVPEKLMKILITDLQASTFDARPIDFQKEDQFYELSMPVFISDSKVLMQEIAGMKNNDLEIPAKFNDFSLLFGKLDLRWDEEAQSFFNTNEMTGLISVNGVPVNRQLKTFIEFKMLSNEDDRAYIYLVSPSDDWYFFGYKQGVLSLASSNPRFNDALAGMNAKELSPKQKDGEVYEIQAAADASVQMFVNKIKAMQSNK